MEKSLDQRPRWNIAKLWQGRLGRLRFFLASLILGIVSIVFAQLTIIIIGAILDVNLAVDDRPLLPDTILFIATILIIACFLFGLLLAMRRCHDFGRSGWIALLLFIPLLNILVILILLFISGDSGRNKFGESSSTKGFWADVLNY